MNLVFQSRRAVSPVIAAILLIVLTIAGTTVLIAVMSNIEESSPEFDTTNASIGSDTTEIPDLSMDIVKLSKLTSLLVEGFEEYVNITISVTYNGPTPFLYVMDFDIIVNGIKLDEISSWSIVEVTGATYTTQLGEYSGYQQVSGSTAVYLVSLINPENPYARIPNETNFIYEVKVGTEQGEISHIFQKEKLSEIIFNNVFYRVAIFHNGLGANWPVDSAASQYEDTLRTYNGTNKLYFNYSRIRDAYDYTNPTLFNVTELILNYDIIVIDIWAVPLSISNVILQLHQAGKSLIFYGSLSNLGQDTPTINSFIDYPLTENITGLIPVLYNGRGPRLTDNYYSFNATQSLVLVGLSGVSFNEVEDRDRGDTSGFDIADLTTNPNATITTYGEAHYYFERSGQILLNHTGPLLVKNERSLSHGRVYSFVWKHDQSLGSRSSSIVDAAQLDILRKNMISSIIQEEDRTISQSSATLSFDLRLLNTQSRWGSYNFDAEITITVLDGDVQDRTLSVTLDMPDQFTFSDYTPRGNIYVYLDNILVLNNLTVSINSLDNTLQIPIGSNYRGDILMNSVIRILIIGDTRRTLTFDNFDRNNFYDWIVSATYDSFGTASSTFSIRLP